MANNILEHNIIMLNSNSTNGGNYNLVNTGSGGYQNPLIANNFYYNYGSGGVNDGNDGNPTVSNPQFQTCPAGKDSWSYVLAPNSAALNSPASFPAQPANDLGIAWGAPGYWGPPGWTPPHTGTAPSYGPSC
jgi:hypothetical protein